MRARLPLKKSSTQDKPRDAKSREENISLTKKLLAVGFILIIFTAGIFGVIYALGFVRRDSRAKPDMHPKPAGKPHPASTFQFQKSSTHAAVTLFGEHHLYQNETGMALKDLIKDDEETVVLLELAPRGKKVDCGKYHVKKSQNITCVGMEDPSYVTKSHYSRITVSIAQMYQIMFGYYQENKNPQFLDKKLAFHSREFLQMSGEKHPESKDLAKLAATPDETFSETASTTYYAAYLASKDIMAKRAKKMSYDAIFKENKKMLEDSEPDLTQYFVERNVVFAAAIIEEVAKKPQRKTQARSIFAVAGAVHMVDMDEPLTESASVLHKKLDEAGVDFQVAANNHAMDELQKLKQ